MSRFFALDIVSLAFLWAGGWSKWSFEEYVGGGKGAEGGTEEEEGLVLLLLGEGL